jgi:pyruvate/2-oxoglutarate dehydrogenase complex dihydrolipoamide acyltransferase (E2) component
VWPVKGEVITPYSNGTDPYAAGQHRGIDIAASVGTPVVAAAEGEVRFAGTVGTSGLTISIRTGDGYDTAYLHLSSLAVRAGARVSAGDRIGAVGTTGTRSATAPHLHLGVRDAGTRHGYHDPLAFLPPPPVAPEPRPPAPAPAPAPEPAGPAPTPAPAGEPVPGAAPIRGPSPAPRPSPGLRVAPRPHSAPATDPIPVPGSAGHRAPITSRELVPARRPEPHPTGRQVKLPIPAAGPDSVTSRRTPGTRAESNPLNSGWRAYSAPNSAATRGPTRPEPGAATARGPSGPDIGWALACGGLLLAAAILGLTGDKRATSARRARIAETLRPLAGRR